MIRYHNFLAYNITNHDAIIQNQVESMSLIVCRPLEHEKG